MRRTKIPSSISRCLWSYRPASLDLRGHRRLIITQVLNYGNWEAVKWLFKTYPEKAIKEVVSHPQRGLWWDQVLNFWCLMLRVRLPKKMREQALFRLGPAT